MENSLTDQEKQFLAKRRMMVRFSPLMIFPLFLMLTGFGAWLYFAVPLLANPVFVMDGIKNNTLEPSSLALMAGLLPIAVWGCFGTSCASLFFSFAVFRTEKKYQQIIDSILEKK